MILILIINFVQLCFISASIHPSMEKVYRVLGGSIPGVFNHPEPEVKAALSLQLNLDKITELQLKLLAEMIAASAEIAVGISPETFRILYKKHRNKSQSHKICEASSAASEVRLNIRFLPSRDFEDNNLSGGITSGIRK
ncbi:hypothetical protein B0H17DRAFT_1140715 [Mycena rosella]|uniref:Uncharacterized protein n=1 Tax=Mycena rosella TaxID=1033263 RepID=A0AAD7D517_MYCRO|nr:hypothetical protein B0H17DRAFT_1140715 [Mycena rosella]